LIHLVWLLWLHKGIYWHLVEIYHRKQNCYILDNEIIISVDGKVHYFLGSNFLYYRQHFYLRYSRIVISTVMWVDRDTTSQAWPRYNCGHKFLCIICGSHCSNSNNLGNQLMCWLVFLDNDDIIMENDIKFNNWLRFPLNHNEFRLDG